MEDNRKTHIHFEIRDVIVMATVLVSALVQYFGMYREHEIRLVRLETHREEMADTLKEMKGDIKLIINKLGGNK